MKAPIDLIRKCQSCFKTQTQPTKKRKHDRQTYLYDYHDSGKPLPQEWIDWINGALIKFFVCCRVPFWVIESPFFIELLKELNSAYNLPSRDILTNRLLKSELGYVNSKVSKELDSAENLTIDI